jgi:hypothetical protein
MDASSTPQQSESSGWEEAVFGPSYGVYAAILASREIPIPSSTTKLTPVQQILLANAVSLHQSRPTGINPYVSSNSLLAQAARLRTEASLETVQEAEYSWWRTSGLYLRRLDAEFDEVVSRILHSSSAMGRMTEESRVLVNHLLFQPLQNVRDHATTDPLTFSGISTRIIERPEPLTPSLSTYLEYINPENQRRFFLEVIIHDDGPGIANHYYRSKASGDAFELFSRPLFSEWTYLNAAFERHATSKRFRQTASTLEQPGIGLAALLNSVKRTRSYFELRTGRMRVYRWYREDEQIFWGSTLLPKSELQELHHIPGTVFRIFIPLAT